MKEESQNSNSKNPGGDEVPQYVSDNIKREQEFGKNIIKFQGELKNDPKYREYFKNYNDMSWNGFVTYYAQQKALSLRFGDFHIKQNEKRDLKYYNEAEKNLWLIQQKKLFNLQCSWRAEKITLPGVEIIADFKYWEDHIKTCTFIEPITEDEFNTFMDYFNDPNYNPDTDYSFSFLSWQEYSTFKRELSADPDSDEGLSYPEWYFFYDSRMGTSDLINLPDVRGEKERFYFKLWQEDWRKKNPPKPNPKIDRRPNINYYTQNFTEEFMKTFEDSKTLKYYRAYKKGSLEHDDSEFDSILFEIQDIKEPIPVEENPDWKEAIKKAYKKYEHYKTGEQLENAFRDYQSRIKMGIGFSDDEIETDHMKKLCETNKKRLIEARVLNGEPPDLNF